MAKHCYYGTATTIKEKTGQKLVLLHLKVETMKRLSCKYMMTTAIVAQFGTSLNPLMCCLHAGPHQVTNMQQDEKASNERIQIKQICRGTPPPSFQDTPCVFCGFGSIAKQLNNA